MDGNEFRQWVEAGFRDYSADPWFFLRELAQNSRDAGAAAIRVGAKRTPGGKEILTFSDNGSGMSFKHAGKYLFRLYASSKEQDSHAAGIFGIGFWSILRPDPKKIKIASNTGKTSWAVEIDRGLDIKRIPVELENRGTRVILEWQAKFENQRQFRRRIREALLRYCRYLRKRDREGTPLPVYFVGENISRAMQVPGPISFSFKKGPIEGAVGLNREPEVVLYARGLPVWRGTSLQELSHTSSAKTDNCEIVDGLAPVFLLNGNNLEVNISRKRVIDNRALAKMKKTAAAALTKLVGIHANRAFNIDFSHRLHLLLDKFKRTWRRLSRSFWKQLLLLLVIILPLEIVLLNRLFTPAEEPQKTPAVFYVDQNRYTGATVMPVSRQTTWDMTYTPPVKTWFKIFTAEKYHIERGFIRGREQEHFSSIPSPHQCAGNPIIVRLNKISGGNIFLPQPVGYIIEPGSVTLHNIPLHRLKFSAGGEAAINVPKGGGILSYRCCPVKRASREKALTAEELSGFTTLPAEFEIPAGLQEKLARYTGLNRKQKVNKAVDLTRSIVRYDDSRETAGRYEDERDSHDWFARVSRIGKGDCDIMNGITVIFLRRLGIPARLVIGFTADKGKPLPGLHAWTEYFDRGWQVVDSSRSLPAAGVSGVKTGPTPGDTAGHPRSKSDRPSSSLLYLLITVLLLLSPVFFLVYKKKRKENNTNPLPHEDDKEKIKETLAQMAAGALLNPGVWGQDNNIWYYRILPTINPANAGSRINKNISLDRALKLTKAGKLLKSRRINPLSQQFKKSAAAVLDKDDRAFHSLINLIPGVIDLDTIFSLRAVPPTALANNRVARLLNAVNRLLKKTGKNYPQCMWTPGLKNRDLLDVNLPASRDFIAVNPAGKQVEMLGWLFQRNPQLAVYNLVKKLVRESRLFPDAQQSILKETAIMLLRGFQYPVKGLNSPSREVKRNGIKETP